jgi:transcriptional regulator with XRE-family HTH domain
MRSLEVIRIRRADKERPKVDWIYRGKVAAKKVELDLSDEDLAELTGLPVGTIRAWACGKRDSDTVADALEKALEIER